MVPGVSAARVFALFALALALLGRPNESAAAQTYAVVAATDVPVDDVTFDDLRRMFLLRRLFWAAGKPVRLVMLPRKVPAGAFLMDQVCQKKEGELRRIVIETLYRGDADQPPKSAASEEEALKMVASWPGSVVVVAANVARPPGVKVLKVEGKSPNETGYPLTR